METLRTESDAASKLADALAEERFTVIDVGCSGGVHPAWRIFGERLTAFGFDPSLHAIQTLKAQETHPGIDYIAGFVGLPEGHPAKDADPEFWRVDPWSRLAAYRTQTLQQAAPQPVAEQQGLMDRNLWREAALAEREQTIVLPDFLDQRGVQDVDVIKIDVDGTDFEILQSLQATLAGRRVLGVMLEVNFHGSAGPQANSFHNIDRFMRTQGFDLLDLTVRKYSLAALPFPYLYPKPLASQGAGGRPFQGDALYLRDFGYPHGGQDAGGWSDDKLLKLAALHALFGLYDHAAETLQLFRNRLEPRVDIDAVLDLLTAELQDAGAGPAARYDSYRAYLAAYEADDDAFYDALRRRSALAAERPQPDVAAAIAAERDAALAEIAAIKRSKIWRLTGPLRVFGRAVLGRR